MCCPLIDTTNQNFIHFGVLSEYLSIGEQLVRYIGRYSSKILI